MNTSVFDDTNKVKGNWAKWNAVGDQIAGTFVSKRQVMNQASGLMQWVYELKLEDGSYWNVGGKMAIDTQMRYVKPGQIVGFKFIESRPAKVAGKSPTKIIQVYANPTLVDTAWLQEQEDIAQQAVPETTDEHDINNIPGFESQPKVDPATLVAAEVTPDSEKLSLINELAKSKLGVTKASEVKLKVMESTGMAFVAANFDAIIKVLAEKK
jgi:hypothetical protein